MPRHLTANRNASKCFANSAPLRYHSITFKNKSKQKEHDNQFKTVAARKFITLDNPPDFINVIPFPADCNDNNNSDANFQKNGLKRLHLLC